MTKHLGGCQAESEGFRCKQPNKDETWFLRQEEAPLGLCSLHKFNSSEFCDSLSA